uniref:Uncharacterized protein n=1 Tax=Periophthalmus magnuspinnatus TaxID=409849 RepID=A0A3B4ASG6_9GOBI
MRHWSFIVKVSILKKFLFLFEFQFPDSQECPSALRLVHEVLQGVGLVFDEQEPNLGVGGVLWDEKKLDDFQNLLYQVLDYPCLSQMGSSGVLDQYFSDVTALIQQQGACGWYILRRDLLWILKTSLRKHHHCYRWTRL